jgi:hypothetical protein
MPPARRPLNGTTGRPSQARTRREGFAADANMARVLFVHLSSLILQKKEVSSMVRRNGLILAVLALMMLPAASAFGQFKHGDWELTLGGSGANGPDFDGVTAGVNGSLGYFLADQFEISLRQSLTYSDFGPGSAWDGSTRVALDFHFDLGAVQPFIGGNLGYVYGDSVKDTWEAAPEAGVKVFLNSTTFVMFLAEYQFFFDTGDSLDNAFSDGQFVYTLGLGVRL